MMVMFNLHIILGFCVVWMRDTLVSNNSLNYFHLIMCKDQELSPSPWWHLVIVWHHLHVLLVTWAFRFVDFKSDFIQMPNLCSLYEIKHAQFGDPRQSNMPTLLIRLNESMTVNWGIIYLISLKWVNNCVYWGKYLSLQLINPHPSFKWTTTSKPFIFQRWDNLVSSQHSSPTMNAFSNQFTNISPDLYCDSQHTEIYWWVIHT